MQSIGRVVIEYDIEFIYPELEHRDGGVQFGPINGANLSAPVAGSDIAIEPGSASWAFSGFQYGCMRLVEGLPAMLMNNKLLAPAAGTLLFYAYDGAKWLLYPTLEGAKNAKGNLRWHGTTPSTLRALFRMLSTSGVTV
jgi:hypothetical protein